MLGLVFGFRYSDALANAYGIAVAGDMLVTTLLVQPWPGLSGDGPCPGVAGELRFLFLDLTFVSANVHKIPSGGWFPLLVGAVSLTGMLSWRRGRAVALAKRDADAQALTDFIAGSAGQMRRSACQGPRST